MPKPTPWKREGAELRRIRLESGKGTGHCAKRVGRSPAQWNNWENGYYVPSAAHIEIIETQIFPELGLGYFAAFAGTRGQAPRERPPTRGGGGQRGGAVTEGETIHAIRQTAHDAVDDIFDEIRDRGDAGFYDLIMRQVQFLSTAWSPASRHPSAGEGASHPYQPRRRQKR